MRSVVVSELVRTVSRIAVIALIGGAAAACSSDTMRFSEAPFSNPFSAKSEPDPNMTGSVDGRQPAAIAPMPRGSVESAPLSAPSQAAAPARLGSAPAYNRPASAPTRTASGRAVPGWRAEGGTPVTVGAGDTVETLAARYGVPANAILSANGLSASQVVPGHRVVIPVYTIGRSAPEAASSVHASAAPVAVAPSQGAVVSRTKLPTKPSTAELQPRSLGEQARLRPAHAKAEPVIQAHAAPAAKAEPRVVADAKSHPRPGRTAQREAAMPKLAAASVRTEEKPVATGKVVRSEKLPVVAETPAKVAKVAPAPAPAPVKVAKAEPAPAPVKAAPQKVAAAEPAKVVVPVEQPKPAAQPAKEVESTASLPAQPVAAASSAPDADFRWPARGRVITGFGGGGANEGINIAVPDGTPVKATEAGVVAYAGSELKGYGNMVLIRHDNGYVSAYAHNGEVEVKRGQKVARGQVIAKSGQSGNVTSPQLHFEIRKGSTPVDPMRFLASN